MLFGIWWTLALYDKNNIINLSELIYLLKLDEIFPLI